MKKDSGLGDVISGLRVAPAGVMCMIHPLINYDDYSYVEPNKTTQIAPYYNGTKMLYAGKSALVLFYDMNSCVQYKVSTT